MSTDSETKMRGAMVGQRGRFGLLAAVTVFAIAATGVGPASSAITAGRPTITKTNDADHDGTFSANETVPGNAVYPYSVAYQLSIFGGTTPGPKGPFHTIVAITDDQTSDIGTCAALVGTTIANGTTKTCSYTITFTARGAQPVVNTATLTYNGGGNDVISSSSTVDFAATGPTCVDRGGTVFLDYDPANVDHADGKVTFCHATSSANNPFVIITTSTSACRAHESHTKLTKGGTMDVFPTAGCVD